MYSSKYLPKSLFHFYCFLSLGQSENFAFLLLFQFATFITQNQKNKTLESEMLMFLLWKKKKILCVCTLYDLYFNNKSKHKERSP